MSNRNRVDKHLLSDLRVQIKWIELNIKPSYLWEISFGDCDHVIDICNKHDINLNDLKVIQINGILFITKIEFLLKHLSRLLDKSFDAFIDVSPDLKSPQLLNRQQIEDKKSILRNIFNELEMNSTKSKFKLESINELINDMCMICGSLLGYPVIYCNNDPQNGNCLSFEPLFHFNVQNYSIETIFSFSCPQKYRHIFDLGIQSWFESMKNRTGAQNLTLKEQIKTLPLVLT